MFIEEITSIIEQDLKVQNEMESCFGDEYQELWLKSQRLTIVGMTLIRKNKPHANEYIFWHEMRKRLKKPVILGTVTIP